MSRSIDLHRVGIGFVVRPRRHAEVTGLRIDRVEPAVRAGLHPGNVVADGGDFPAREMLGRNHHGEVGLAAGAGESRRDIVFSPFRRFHAEDEHVLGEPALLLPEIGADAQRQAFFPSSTLPP